MCFTSKRWLTFVGHVPTSTGTFRPYGPLSTGLPQPWALRKSDRWCGSKCSATDQNAVVVKALKRGEEKDSPNRYVHREVWFAKSDTFSPDVRPNDFGSPQ